MPTSNRFKSIRTLLFALYSRRQEPPKEEIPRCSFCSKSKSEVKRLIAGPAIYICNECVDVCNALIADTVEQKEELDLEKQLSEPGLFLQERKRNE